MNNIIEVKALIDTDFCKKWDIISMKKWVFETYHKNNFEVVGAKKSTKKVDKIPQKKDKAMKVAKNK